jgi:hypothetical protein
MPFRVGKRAAAALILVAACSSPECSNASTSNGHADQRWTAVFEKETWYRDRTEPERVFTGVLVRRTSPQGPGARLGLSYALRVGTGELPIYAARVEQSFERYVGQTVTVRGKLVNFSAAEGSGKELWVGGLSASPMSP